MSQSRIRTIQSPFQSDPDPIQALESAYHYGLRFPLDSTRMVCLGLFYCRIESEKTFIQAIANNNTVTILSFLNTFYIVVTIQNVLYQ